MTYRDEMFRVLNKDVDKLSLGAMGLAGESGEVIDLIKKHLFHGKPLDNNKLIEELGDVRWYLELLFVCTGTTMTEVEERNIAKLRKRYPNGFTTQDSIERKDEK